MTDSRQPFPDSLLDELLSRKLLSCERQLGELFLSFEGGAFLALFETPLVSNGDESCSQSESVYHKIGELVGSTVSRTLDFGSGFEIEFDNSTRIEIDCDKAIRRGPEVAVLDIEPLNRCEVWG